MPKGPNGEKRPADVIGGAIMVGRIATGDIEEIPVIKSGRVRSGHSGGAARAKTLSPEQRSEVAKEAANARWRSKGKCDVETAMEHKVTAVKTAQKERAVSMYPDNQLGAQKRDFKDTFRMSTVLIREFFDKK